MAKFIHLAAFSDVIDGLKALKAQSYQLVAFSNDPEVAQRALLKNAAVLPYLDDVQTYKPSPVVYQHLLTKTQSSKEDCWMISSNPWDVIGGKAAGLNAAWIQRDPSKIFDPWGVKPDVIVSDLIQLSQQL